MSTSGGHNAPIVLFEKLIQCIKLEENKHMFKTYPNSFVGENAIRSMKEAHNFDGEKAVGWMTGLLEAQLIINAEKPQNTDFKSKNIYCISVKGGLALRDVKAKRTNPEAPEVVYARNQTVKTNLIFVDRDRDGNLLLAEPTVGTVFKYAFGHKLPNFTKFENPSLTFVEGSPEVEMQADNGNLTPITAMFLKDKIVSLKGYTHAFSSASLVDWILRNTSVMSRREAIQVASMFIDYGWIASIGTSEDSSGRQSVSASQEQSGSGITCAINTIKDSSRAVYQPTALGAKFLSWDLSKDTPTTTSVVQGIFGSSRNKVDVSRKDASRNEEVSSPKSPGMEVSKNTAHTLTVDDGDMDWEFCHTKLISMDGTKAGEKRKTPTSPFASGPSSAASSAGGMLVSENVGIPVINKILNAARPKANAIKKACAAKYNPANMPEMHPMDASKPRGSQVMQLMAQSHSARLVQILESPDLSEQFRKYNHFMYSQENFTFWREADAFRRMYSPVNAIIVPGQPISYRESVTSGTPSTVPSSPTAAVNSSAEEQPAGQIVAHAMAMYLKFIVDDSPYEVNVGSLRKKSLTAILTATELLPFFDLINPDSIISDDVINPKTVLLPGTEAMFRRLDSSIVASFTSSMFDAPENHIFTLMATDSVPKFLKTSAYHDTLCGKS